MCECLCMPAACVSVSHLTLVNIQNGIQHQSNFISRTAVQGSKLIHSHFTSPRPLSLSPPSSFSYALARPHTFPNACTDTHTRTCQNMYILYAALMHGRNFPSNFAEASAGTCSSHYCIGHLHRGQGVFNGMFCVVHCIYTLAFGT